MEDHGRDIFDRYFGMRHTCITDDGGTLGRTCGACVTEAGPRKETRIVDEKTGAQKGSKRQRFDLIPPEALWALAEHYGVGCEKYADRNWERGYRWGLSVAALERHLTQWKMGEDYDAETGSHHLIAVIWHAIALFIYQLRGLGTDDVRQSARTTNSTEGST